MLIARDYPARLAPSPGMHPATAALLRFFAYEHLPLHLQTISERFHDLAVSLAEDPTLDGAELTVALRKLLEAKDCAVRAALPTH